MKRLRLKDIAEQAGVSVYTVSSALSGNGQISEANRIKIREISARLGYQPNIAGRILNGRQNRDMGLLILGSEEEISRNIGFADFNMNFMRLCMENGIRHQMEWFSPKEHTDKLPSLLTAGLVGGVVVAGEPCGAVRDYLDSDNVLPHVMLAGHGRYSVGFNMHHAFEEAIGHLTELGHHRIAMLNGFESYHVYQSAKSGYLAALDKHGIEFDPAFYWAPDQEFSLVDRVRNGMEFLFSGQKERPTALLASGGLLVKSVVSWLQQRNLQVPNAVSVIAFESAAWEARNFIPPLSAVEYDYFKAARAIFDLLSELIKDKNTRSEAFIQINEIFTPRESCAIVPVTGP